MEPRVSVGIPAYNAQRYLGDAIESNLAQTFGDIEVIISDNASTDRTEEIARSYAQRDPRVRYVRAPVDVGAARNFNRLVELARAPYFRWSPADDLSAPTLIERCLAILDRDPTVAIAFPKTLLIDAEGNRIREYEDNLHLIDERPSARFERLLDGIGLCNAQYGLMRTAVMRRTALLGVFVGSDVPFLAEMALRGKLWEIPERLFLRRFHERASSAMTEQQRAVFYEPVGGERLQLVPRWRILAAHVRSIARVPLSITERLRALGILARRAHWSHHELVQELLRLVRLKG